MIASAAPQEEEPKLDLDFLGGRRYANGEQVLRDDFLEESGASYAADARSMRERKGNADIVYGHARHDGDGHLWLQYWLFYYYNDKGLLDIGLHEGDWEMIQLRLGEDGQPDAATYGQHAGAERAAWDEVERQQTDVGAAPVLYCARGSHAPRFRPGTHEAPIVPDHNDGLGPRVRPRLVTIGDEAPGWVLWPGRWGSTRRREAFEADSPRGPARASAVVGPRRVPLRGAPGAGGASLGNGGGRDAAAGHAAPDRDPRRRSDRRRLPAFPNRRGRGGGGANRRRSLRGEGAGVPRTRSVTVESREGSFALQLAPGERPEGVRASAASEHGVPGETIAAPLQGGERAG